MRVHCQFAGGPAEGVMTSFYSKETLLPPESIRVAYTMENNPEKIPSHVYFLEDSQKMTIIPGHWTALYGLPIPKESAPSLITVWL